MNKTTKNIDEIQQQNTKGNKPQALPANISNNNSKTKSV
jgi:hypothetical protein